MVIAVINVSNAIVIILFIVVWFLNGCRCKGSNTIVPWQGIFPPIQGAFPYLLVGHPYKDRCGTS
jgi:hypothetical protein